MQSELSDLLGREVDLKTPGFLSDYNNLPLLAGCRSDQEIDRGCGEFGGNRLIFPILSAFIRQTCLIHGLSAFSRPNSHAGSVTLE